LTSGSSCFPFPLLSGFFLFFPVEKASWPSSPSPMYLGIFYNLASVHSVEISHPLGYKIWRTSLISVMTYALDTLHISCSDCLLHILKFDAMSLLVASEGGEEEVLQARLSASAPSASFSRRTADLQSTILGGMALAVVELDAPTRL
jgi:hypothetical protein